MINLIPIDFLNEELLLKIFSIKEKAETFKLFKDIFSKPRGYATIIFSYLPEANNLRVEQFSTQLSRWEDRKQQLEGTTFAVMENNIFCRVLMGKETVYDDTYPILKEIFPEIYNDTRSLDLGNSIVVPLTSQSKVMGALLVSSVGLDPSSIPEVQILGDSISAILNIVDHHLKDVKIERTLKENEERLNFTIENFHEAVMWTDPQTGLIVNCNRAAELLLEKERHEIVDHPLTRVLSPEKAEYYLGLFRSVMKGGFMMADQEVITKSGKVKFVDLSAFPVLVNNRLLFQGIFRDVSEKKKMEEDLSQSEVKYRLLVENAHEGIWAIDTDMKVAFVNPCAAEMLGYTIEEMFGRSIYEFMDKKSIVIAKNKLAWRKIGISESYELEYIRKDRKKIYTNVTVSPILDEKGIFAGVLAFVTDLSDKRRMEEEIRSLAKFSDDNPSPILRLSQDGVILASNRSSGSLLESWGCKVGGYAPKNWCEVAREVITLKSSKTVEVELEGKVLLFLVVPIVEEGYINLYGRDITDRKKMEEELRRYAEHLSELVEEKTNELRDAERLITMGQVATMVGHDLRNPLQVLVNLAYLEKKEVDKLTSPTGIELQDLFATAEKQIEYMNKIVSDLQDYGRTLEPHYTKVKLDKLIADSLAIVNVPERVKVLVDIQEGFPSLVIDFFMMERMFTNLIMNSFQAMSEGGRLMISASVDGGMALICVKDTGVGMSEENMSKLFTPLFTTKAKGQGLGLVVCKRLVEANRGSISVESKVGVGSTFKVRIPLR